MDFGAFVRLEEGVEGLIHISELAEGNFLHPRNVVHEHETVRVRVLSVDVPHRRLGLSLRQAHIGNELASHPAKSCAALQRSDRTRQRSRVSTRNPVSTPETFMSKSATLAAPKLTPNPKPKPRKRRSRAAANCAISFGARSREIGGVLLIALALLSLLALSNLTRGSLSDWWSNGLYWLFGWGAFAFAIMLGAIGVLIIARTQNIVLATPWRSIIAIEIAFFALLPVLTAFGAFADQDMWRMITQGFGGGVVGWGLLTIVAPIFSRSAAGLLYLVILIVALTIGLRLPWLTWYARLKIWLVRRRPIETVAIPAAAETVAVVAGTTDRGRDRAAAAGCHQSKVARSASGAGHAIAAEDRQGRRGPRAAEDQT